MQKEPEIHSGISGFCCNMDHMLCNLLDKYWHNSEVFVNMPASVEIPARFRYNKQS